MGIAGVGSPNVSHCYQVGVSVTPPQWARPAEASAAHAPGRGRGLARSPVLGERHFAIVAPTDGLVTVELQRIRLDGVRPAMVHARVPPPLAVPPRVLRPVTDCVLGRRSSPRAKLHCCCLPLGRFLGLCLAASCRLGQEQERLAGLRARLGAGHACQWHEQYTYGSRDPGVCAAVRRGAALSRGSGLVAWRCAAPARRALASVLRCAACCRALGFAARSSAAAARDGGRRGGTCGL